ncbi:AraC-like transcriptional regulator QhpR [Pseudomonas sp. S31]|uniref:AraC-like transcriptional regulator QhpR n=1 Tax=Pseudomonas sp. S31 TaxID=1564473 RepID=UPI001F3FCF46|nr:AraC family transcriptional regulator [Pseudomonas sp. S31]
MPILTDATPHKGVLAAAATGLFEFIKGHGGEPAKVIGQLGVNRLLLENPTISLSLPDYCTALEESARICRCDNFGLYYGQQFRPQHLGLLGYIGLSSHTLEEALVNFARAFPLHQHHSLIRLIDQGETYRFDYQVRHGAIMIRRQDAELTLGMVVNLIREVLGRDWSPRAVHFEHPKPKSWKEHERLFGAPVQFGQSYNSLVIPKNQLVRLMPSRDPMLLALMQGSLTQISSQTFYPQQTMVEVVREYVRQMLRYGEPKLADAAREIKIQEKLLQARLRDEGTSFSKVVDQVRKEIASFYLKHSELSASELTSLLGYSEISVFSRATKRWFGIASTQLRKKI